MKSVVCLVLGIIFIARSVYAGQSYIEGFFNEANAANMAEVCEKYYHPDVVFVDPVHKITSRAALTEYYLHLYNDIDSIRFSVSKEVREGDDIFAAWTMLLSHPSVNGGKEFSVEGASHVRLLDGKIVYHRDYFDLGEMIYERIPVLGRIVRLIKGRVAGG